MEQQNAKLKDRIRSVQRNFVTMLPTHINDINQHWKSLRYVAWDHERVLELQTLVHRLAGSGGTFGFPDISQASGAVDVALTQALMYDKEQIPPEAIVNLELLVTNLQRVLSEVAATAENSGEELPVLTAKVEAQKALIVVIDDDLLLREHIGLVLENAGYEVALFAEPPAAIHFLQEQQPALILLDLMFPNQRWPAFEVINDIRGETAQRTPVAVMSGRADFRSRLQATRAGADAYLTKPLDESQLLTIAKQLTAKHLQQSWRCLVVDDDELLAQQLVEWLRQSGMIAEYVSNPRDSWLKIREFNPDVLVLDIRMPECNGIEFATMLRQDIETSQLPIVFLTSENADRTRRQAMAAGADDYLLKPIEREAFLHAVKIRARLSQRLQGQVNRIIQQAPQGAGLSRHFFFNQFERTLDDANDSAVQAALVLVGLVQTVEALKQQSPVALAALQEQLLARVRALELKTWSMLGDNMIGVLLPKDTVSTHQASVKNILKQLSAQPYVIDDLSVDSQMCAAVLYLGSGQTAANTLLLQAEHMLGMAIESGAGTVLEGVSGTAREAETTGKLAVSRLRMLYQPIVTIADSSDPVSSVLVRLADADGNLLPAGQFLDAVEKRGWLPELDAWIFNNAHHILTEQLAADTAQCLIVHASPVSLNNTLYLETVFGLLSSKPMRHPRQRLVIAIPEAAAVTHRHNVEKLNQALVNAGCGLMLTGFGASTGASKILQYLQPLYVRLDQSVTKRLEQTDYLDSDRQLISAIETAQAIMVADGIENAKSMSGLWAKGIRWFQGYFIHEPVAELGVNIEG